MDGYEVMRSDHPSDTKRGGVAIYYKEHLPLKRRVDLENINECIVCEVKVNRYKCFITCLYRSPSQLIEDFDELCTAFEDTLSKINLETPLCSVVLGDFNGKCSSWWAGDTDDACGIELNTLTSCSGYTQLIWEPTNFEPNKLPSCIDLIFTNQPNLVLKSGVHSSLFNTCHHQITFARIDFQVHLPPPYKREVWSYEKAEERLIKESIKNFNWDNAFLNLNPSDQVKKLSETLLNIFPNFIPHNTITCYFKDPPWIEISYKTVNRLSELEISNCDVLKILNNFYPNKTHDWDGIFIKMIRLHSDTLVYPLKRISENCLEAGDFPDTWKCGNIVPIHKKESKHFAKNYRPISLLPIFGIGL